MAPWWAPGPSGRAAPMTRVKVCCIQDVDEADMAVRAGASALGLVAAMPSGPGPIPEKRIRQVADWAPPGVATFLLTAEIEADAIVEELLGERVACCAAGD